MINSFIFNFFVYSLSHVFIYLFIYFFVFISSFVYLFIVYSFIYISTYLFMYLFIYLFTYLWIHSYIQSVILFFFFYFLIIGFIAALAHPLTDYGQNVNIHFANKRVSGWLNRCNFRNMFKKLLRYQTFKLIIFLWLIFSYINFGIWNNEGHVMGKSGNSENDLAFYPVDYMVLIRDVQFNLSHVYNRRTHIHNKLHVIIISPSGSHLHTRLC